MRTIQKILSSNIRELRGNRTMADIAEAANIPFRTFQSIDMGERWPRIDNLEAIAGALGVPVSRLFRDPNETISTLEAWEIVGKAIHEKPSPTPLIPGIDPAQLEALLAALAARPGRIDGVMAAAGVPLSTINESKSG